MVTPTIQMGRGKRTPLCRNRVAGLSIEDAADRKESPLYMSICRGENPRRAEALHDTGVLLVGRAGRILVGRETLIR